MKRFLLSLFCLCLLCALVLGGLSLALRASPPPYEQSLGYDYYPEKLKGLYLQEQAAKADNLFVLGSSELNTTMIASHPSNFFKENDPGFQVFLVGRGSCQSLIHAMNAAAFAENLQGQKLVLISSPQHFIPGGIEPDMFVANFSKLQYLKLMADDELPPELRRQFSLRVSQNLERYETEISPLGGYEDVKIAAALGSSENALARLAEALLRPYYALEGWLLARKDIYDSAKLIKNAEGLPEHSGDASDIDWEQARLDSLSLGALESDNNDFQMLNDYYMTNVGSRLARMKDRDKELSYSESVEYDDLRLLLEVCEAYGLEAMYVHIPLHGDWSDFTGFEAERRQDYYEKVRRLVGEYDVKLLDLTGNEYADYYLCDVMHIGWTGWVDIDEAFCEFYYES